MKKEKSIAAKVGKRISKMGSSKLSYHPGAQDRMSARIRIPEYRSDYF